MQSLAGSVSCVHVAPATPTVGGGGQTSPGPGTLASRLRSPFLSPVLSILYPQQLHAWRTLSGVPRRMTQQPTRAVLDAVGRTLRGFVDKASGLSGVQGAASLAAPSFTSTQPSWEALAERLSKLRDPHSAGEGRVAHAKERLFGSTEEPRVVFFRDNSSWCPYCERVWLQLEEKRVPYRVEKINMRCYGEKPLWYTRMVPSGLLPAVQIDGELITESLDIMFELEKRFQAPALLPPPGSPDLRAVEGMLRQERQLMGAWLQLVTSSWGNTASFEAALTRTDELLQQRGGPYFLGKEFSLVDAVYAPFLERIACSVPYWKGLVVRNNGRWPAVDAWFDAMDSRPAYAAIKSDDFSIVHNLEPQIGRCGPLPEGRPYRDLIDGRGGAWDLPLKPESTAWGSEPGGRNEAAEQEAAASLVGNHEAVVRFALRGVRGGEGNERLESAVGEGLRYVAAALLEGIDSAGPVPEGLPQEAAVAAAYLRDRVGVPRDLSYPAARALRAHLQYLVRGMGSNV